MTALEILKNELKSRQKDLRKSKEAFLDGRIDIETRYKHIMNIPTIITDLETSIKKLKA
jgi:hypothetical protein